MTFSIKKSFQDSWKMFFSKKIYLPFVLTSLVAIAGLYAIFGVSGFAGSFFLLQGLWWVLIPLGIIFLFFSAYFILVSVHLPLSTYKNGEVDFKKTFKDMWDWKLIVKAVGLLFLVGVGALLGGYILSILGSKIHPILGIVLFVVWVAYVAVNFAFSLYILTETKGVIVSSLKKSFAMMKGNGWKFLVFIVVVTFISMVIQILGDQLSFVLPMVSEILVILFGILVAPWFSLLTVSPYLQIKG